MSSRHFNVLFLCTGNSARSIIAESILNSVGKDRFTAFSAGSHPGGTVNPLVLDFLKVNGVPAEGAAAETCPVWPGHPAQAHWGAPDPAVHMDNPDKAKQVIRDVFHMMQRRISLLASLPIDKLDRLALQRETQAIATKA